jgi:hypothetical protein
LSKFVVEGVEYDFEQYGGKGKGTIPEPSDADVERFQERMLAFTEETGIRGLDDLIKKLSGMEPDERKSYARDQETRAYEMYAEFCKNSPSVEEIKSVPPRIRRAFFHYVQQEFFNPNT